MTGLWITLGILACLAFLLWMPVTLHFTYEESLSIKLGYLFLRFQLLPRKPKKQKAAKTAPQEEKSGEEAKKPEEQKKDLFPIIMEVIKASGTALKKALRKITVYDVQFRATIIREDAYETAMGYSRICCIVSGIAASLRNFFTLKIRSISIAPDFTRYEGGDIYKLHFKAKIRPYAALWIGLGFGVEILRFIFKQQQAKQSSRQGGALQWQNIQ